LLVAGLVVCGSTFLPLKLQDLSRFAAARRTLPALLHQHGVQRALVFHTQVVPSWTELGWAYYPPINSPGLDDDVLFARLPFGADGLARSVEFWQRRHADRQAWVHLWLPGEGPRLLPLMAYVDAVSRGELPVAVPAEEVAGG
jgi:hypothetical protein